MKPCQRPGIPVGIPTEVEATEHLHQLGKSRQRGGTMAAQQLKGRFPVVVPASFALEGIDGFIAGPPSAEVQDRFGKGAAVTSRHIPDHSVDVKQKNGLGRQGGSWVAAGKVVVCV